MYNDSYYSNEFDLFFGGLLIVILFVALFFALISYILTAIIYYNAAKTNGLGEIAFWSWIPLINVYVLFALGSKKTTLESIKKEALTILLVYIGITIVTFIPIIGVIASIALAIIGFYYMYLLFYRWTGDSGKSILFIVLTVLTAGIFYLIYGLIKMKQPFVA